MREDVKFECTNCAIVAKTAIDILKKQKGSKIGSVVSMFLSQDVAFGIWSAFSYLVSANLLFLRKSHFLLFLIIRF